MRFTAAGWWTPAILLQLACSPAAERGVPAEDPYIRGTITDVQETGFLVEEDPTEVAGSPKAWVQYGDQTRVLHASGVEAGRTELTEGRQVSVWVVGPVLESYPVQATAGTVVLAEGS
jgi:hypothetical protein